MRKVKKNNEISAGLVSYASCLLSDYEDIRSYATGEICSLSRPLGLDLFLKVGFLNWIKVQKESEVCVRPEKKSCTIKEKRFLPGDQDEKITLILANMILEERSSHVLHH